MKRRDFLRVVGAAVLTPSLLGVSASSPERFVITEITFFGSDGVEPTNVIYVTLKNGKLKRLGELKQ